MSVLENVSFAGGIVGLASGIFVLFDRLLRGRPLAFVTVKGNLHNPMHYIRIKNVSAIDLIILDIKGHPASYKVSKGHSVKEIANAITDVPAVTVLGPTEERDFTFFESPNREDGKNHTGPVRFSIYWRKSTCTWLRQIPVWVFTSTSDLDRMGNGLS